MYNVQSKKYSSRRHILTSVLLILRHDSSIILRLSSLRRRRIYFPHKNQT